MDQPKAFVLVVGIDYSELSAHALERALELGKRIPRTELHVAHVARAIGPMLQVEALDEVLTLSTEQASDYLLKYVERKVESYRQAHPNAALPTRIVTHLRMDEPAESIAQLASDVEADLVVVGTHGRRGLRRLLVGSVAEAVVRLAPCAVLVERPRDQATQARVPNIEPPCPRCIETRKATGGEQLWCEQHRERHGRPHTYHYLDRNVQSSENLPMTTPLRR